MTATKRHLRYSGRADAWVRRPGLAKSRGSQLLFRANFHAVRRMEKFRVKYSGANSLIEFCGDHRAENYPNVSKLLADALGAMPQKHAVFSAETMIATDRYFSHWSYKNGIYEIDDDIWGCLITVPNGHPDVIADLKYALTNSGQFVSTD